MQVLQWQEVVPTGKIQSIEMMSATEFMERYNSLTDIQLRVLLFTKLLVSVRKVDLLKTYWLGWSL